MTVIFIFMCFRYFHIFFLLQSFLFCSFIHSLCVCSFSCKLTMVEMPNNNLHSEPFLSLCCFCLSYLQRIFWTFLVNIVQMAERRWHWHSLQLSFKIPTTIVIRKRISSFVRALKCGRSWIHFNNQICMIWMWGNTIFMWMWNGIISIRWSSSSLTICFCPSPTRAHTPAHTLCFLFNIFNIPFHPLPYKTPKSKCPRKLRPKNFK